MTSTSQDTNSKSKDRAKRLAKALEFDNIRPIKLFSKSLPIKSESVRIVRKDASRVRDRGNPATASSSSGPKVKPTSSSSSSGAVSRRTTPAGIETMKAKTAPIARSHLPNPRILTLQHPEAPLTATVASGSTNELEVSTTLSVATELPEMPFYSVCLDQDVDNCKLEVVAAESPAATVSNLQPPSPVSCGGVTAAVTFSRSPPLVITEADRDAGRNSPTLSELSQEEQYQHTDSESDNTEVYSTHEHSKTLNREQSTELFGKTFNRNSSSNLKNVLGDVSKAGKSKERKNSACKSINSMEDGFDNMAEGMLNSPLRWRRGQAIGEGTFGRVYKGKREQLL